MLAIEQPQLTFVSGESSRRVSLYADMPYGSHYTNDRFQLKRGPAVAVVGAIGSISSGVAMGGFLGGVMIAGGVMSAIGAISGNETLSNIGMGLGLVGGIGGAFTNAAGDFVNPFTNFGESQLGQGLSKMGSGIKNFFGDVTGTSDAVAAMNLDGGQAAQGIVDAAGEVPSVTQSSFTTDAVNKLGTGGTGIDLSAKVSPNFTAGASGSSGGMLSSLLGNKDMMNMIGGAADGWGKYQELEQNQPLIDANVDFRNAQTDQLEFETDLAAKRYNNMQAQKANVAKVNPNAQLYGNNPVQGEPKIAVAMNGKVEYLTTDEYAALQQQQGGGLLMQGA